MLESSCFFVQVSIDLSSTDDNLGLMIRGGIDYGLGIYVTGVDKAKKELKLMLSWGINHTCVRSTFPLLQNSCASVHGILAGDEILEVNGRSFSGRVTHDEAVRILTYSEQRLGKEEKLSWQ